jgi:hypothetical protein
MTSRQEAISRGNPFFTLSSRMYASIAMIAHKAADVPHALKKRMAPHARPQGACVDQSGSTCVLHIIRKSKAGVHPAVLAQMTGYGTQRLERILHKLFKRGEIMIEIGGVYAGAKPFRSGGLREI